jgi:hypothetical protein
MMTTLFLLLLSTCVRAQNSKVQIIESETDSGYTFSLRDSKIDRRDLVATFAEVAGVNVHPNFRGDWQSELEEGIKITVDTRRDLLRVRYRGNDPEKVKRAKEKAALIRELLQIPPPTKSS